MSNFEINNKLFSTTGIIGRRDFIVNYLIINCIISLLLTPLFYFFVFNPEYIVNFYQNSIPQWFFILCVIKSAISSILLFPSIVRRIRDIFAIDSNEKLNLIATTVIVIFIISSTPVMNKSIGNFLSTFVLFLLFLWQGKITSQKPKNEVVKFNWGAFFGTWIWGIINKKPITFLIIPLFFTIAWFPFMLICGLKGNEWAFEKNQKNIDNIENFHKNQEKQSLLLLIFVPIISIIIIGFLSYFGSVATIKYAKNNPEFRTKIKTFLLKQQASSVDAFYSKIEIKDGVATFYLPPESWESSTRQMKESIYKNAISYALQKQGKKGLLLTDFVENIDLVNNVKILSSFNNEPLAQFYLDSKTIEQKTQGLELKEVQKFWNSGYKFNNSPTLP
jgi:hypothetical protein